MTVFNLLNSDPDSPDSAPPGSPIDRNDQLKHSNWFETQLSLALLIGISSFISFCYIRIRSIVPRSLLKQAHQPIIPPTGFFSWILPTIKTNDQSVLNAAGLDALVLLYFFKLGFYYFLTITILAFIILVPINVHENGTTEGVPPKPSSPTANSTSNFKSIWPPPDLTQNITIYHSSHLFFTYLFSILLLRLLQSFYLKIINLGPIYCLSNQSTRQSLKTIIIENLPRHLRNEEALKDYFEKVLGYQIQSIEILRDINNLIPLLKQRNYALNQLELGYYKLNLNHKRPNYRLSWFHFKKVDWINHWETEFNQLNQLIEKKRNFGKFKPLSIGFICFKNISDAQILCQTLHWPIPDQAIISLAPDSRDVHWENITISTKSRRIRITLVWISMALLYGFWAPPVSFLANLMSYEVLVSWLSPVLVELIERSSIIKALIQNSLPTLAIIGFNAILPSLLDWLCTFQGFKSRSAIEYSLLRKYHLFLLVTVLFIFVAVSTVSLLRDLRDNPGGVVDKLARSLPGARYFFISYLILQSLAILPLQLLSLPNFLFRLIFLRPKTLRQKNYKKMMKLEILSLGTIYPQALLAFNICITYSIIAPLILIFGTIYFGFGYIVYKYKILNVYCRPFESRGEAWPIACHRIGWGLIIFQVFMFGLLSLRQVFLLSTLVLPLVAYTIYNLITLQRVYRRQAKYLSLSMIAEVEADQLQSSSIANQSLIEPEGGSNDGIQETSEEIVPVPLQDIFIGIERIGKRSYGHPAITGILPMPQLDQEQEGPVVGPLV
ncbi:hypothetical protein CROQUDRAFT_654026 [Cronartium quercuum f. sp. fusiforme G11]|uniref:DUF221-domain-containing protein n=1 Tax=Cronartium quercuum f. sp. fusiforme G11 TaxID=708437 RepID=A0A9P6TEB6_9BASI|nr:hypothetical protein CROQUDRAFT_654026 [Cronartium quercuum f. sp. fusiforme G11]